ncbi:polysaccharide biosynthesis protein [bacterium]|nr:polysaccharide biosynthesis protein [bacterium]
MTDFHLQRLLGRDEIEWDLEEIAAYLRERHILVTGAGGSIGSELSRQIGKFCPQGIVLLGRGEQSIWEIHRDCSNRFPDLDIRPVIADIRDRSRMESVFEEYRPAAVFHTAAHKHVDLIEPHPEEVVINNIVGTRTVTKLADAYGTNRVVMISTDKAVRPACVYGAGKRISELQVEGLARESSTVFVTVRFGNVLGSRGSVVPMLQTQIAEGGPVTVHPDATRYFMTIPEAARLVIQSGAMGENGEIFILDMGEPVRILDLATEMIRLAGKEPGIDMELKPIGLRPGDKLHEELLSSGEGVRSTKHKKIFIAQPDRVESEGLDETIDRLAEMAKKPDRQGIVDLLQAVVPEYKPSEMWRKDENH